MGVIVHDSTINSNTATRSTKPEKNSTAYFLKIDGIPGDSQEPTHLQEIEIERWSWGESQSTEASSSGSGAGKVKMQDFQFTMRINRTSPKLLLACAAGMHLKKVILTGRTTGENPGEFLKITFSDVVVSSFQSECDRGLPYDHVSIQYAVIEYDYTAQKPDGSPESIKVGWDLKQNRSV